MLYSLVLAAALSGAGPCALATTAEVEALLGAAAVDVPASEMGEETAPGCLWATAGRASEVKLTIWSQDELPVLDMPDAAAYFAKLHAEAVSSGRVMPLGGVGRAGVCVRSLPEGVGQGRRLDRGVEGRARDCVRLHGCDLARCAGVRRARGRAALGRASARRERVSASTLPPDRIDGDRFCRVRRACSKSSAARRGGAAGFGDEFQFKEGVRHGAQASSSVTVRAPALQRLSRSGTSVRRACPPSARRRSSAAVRRVGDALARFRASGPCRRSSRVRRRRLVSRATSAASAVAMPAAKPPPEQGTSTASNVTPIALASSTSSSPIVPWPAMTW